MESRIATLLVVIIVVGSIVAGIVVGARRDASPEAVDLIVYNGQVFTGAGSPRAEAVAIKGNQIAQVGSNREIKKLRTRGTQMIDAHGAAVLPGFNDSHVHFMGGGLALERVSLLGAQTLDAIKNTISEFARANPDRAWILGRGWYYSPFPGGLPTRELLDELVPDRPAYLTCYDGHTSWANSRALALAGITKDTPNPPNGVIVKDPKTGEPTGVLKEAAMGLMAKALPETTPADRVRAIRAAVKEANRLGITSVHEAGTSATAIGLFEEVRKTGDLTVRVYAALSAGEDLDGPGAEALDTLRTRYTSDPVIKVGAIKLMIDGVIEAHTAVMLEPYANRPSRGEPMYSLEGFRRVVTELDKRGWQILTHAIGDGAVRLTLDAYEAAAQANPAPARGRRHRIEHAETIAPVDVPRFGATNTIVSYMPFHGNPTPAQLTVWTTNIGPERASRGWMVRGVIESGARVTLGSDWPVVDLDPRLQMHMAITRKTPDGKPAEGWLPEQAISLEQAIEGTTSWPAYASFEDHRKGRLAPGQLADLVILSGDIFSWPSDKLLDAHVSVTIFDGKVVYEK